ncbi:hypothetical protein EXE58_15225 [Nocardioides seonyuensis]|uniref:DUF4175 domain-containing protein n=1 Tax=Nocardioides seonyuensis TaxID=2518371 RepID=A0A4P7IK31_9ACTN|nr:hypothetical protein [Nocardioides seonyuensis]QBX56677.1 hypothetical protein EXE58_15225 [Nocardioides seonyuensis]
MTGTPVREAPSPWAIAGMVGMACVLFMIVTTPLVTATPWWAVALLVVAWVGALLVSVAWFVRRPRMLPVLAVAMAVVWFATIVLGARYLTWG